MGLEPTTNPRDDRPQLLPAIHKYKMQGHPYPHAPSGYPDKYRTVVRLSSHKHGHKPSASRQQATWGCPLCLEPDVRYSLNGKVKNALTLYARELQKKHSTKRHKRAPSERQTSRLIHRQQQLVVRMALHDGSLPSAGIAATKRHNPPYSSGSDMHLHRL